MLDTIHIRLATKEDLPVLMQFEQEIIKAERPFDPTLKPEKFHYYDIKQMIESEDADVFVAEINKNIIGSGHVRIRRADSFNSFEKYAFLGFMFVVPEHRGKRINQKILEELKYWALQKGVVEIRLQVYDENLPAIRAYEKAGFKKILTEMRMSIEK